MTSRSTSDYSLTRLGLTANAALSFLVGGLFLLGAPAVSGALGVEVDGWIRVFGVVLIGHSLILAWARRARNPAPWTWLNLAMVAPYPLLMIILAFAVIEPSGGRALVLLDGVLVGSAGLLQYLGLRSNPEPVAVGRTV